MFIKFFRYSSLLIAASLFFSVGTTSMAEARCVNKAAVATSPTTNQAKWFAMETIVQQVSWGLWPGWVATGKTPGYVFKNKKYRCKQEGVMVTCNASATICKAK